MRHKDGHGTTEKEVLPPTGKMGGDEEERCAEEYKGHAHSSFGLDLRDDPGGDRGVLHFCAGPRQCWDQ